LHRYPIGDRSIAFDTHSPCTLTQPLRMLCEMPMTSDIHSIMHPMDFCGFFRSEHRRLGAGRAVADPLVSLRTGLILRLAISLFVIAALFHFIDLGLVVDRLRLLRPVFLAAIFALVFVQIVLFAVRWSFIAEFCRAGIGVALAVRFSIISMFFNQTLPGTLGADSIRILLSVGEGVSVKLAFLGVAIDRVLALIVLIGLAAASLPLLAMNIVETRLAYGMAGLTGALVLGIVVFVSLPALLPQAWLRWRVVRVLIELSQATSALLINRRLVTLTVPLAAAVHLISGAIVVLCAIAMNIALDPISTMILMLPTLLAMAIPISIAGWGVREGTMVIALGQVGVLPADALALSVAFGLINMLAGIPGGILWLIWRPRRAPVVKRRIKLDPG